MRLLRNLVLLVVGIVAGALGWAIYQLGNRPSLEPYADYILPTSPAEAAPGAVRVTYLGVSTVLVSDGETAIMTDGFFTRPGGWLNMLVGAKISPDRALIMESLARAGIEDLAAVIVVHSHYDHAMDAPVVAELTGAKLIGSESTANVGRGLELDETSIVVAVPGEPIELGSFSVTMIESRHFPLPFAGSILGKPIAEPLVPPASVFDYLEGGSYSVLIEHALGSLLIQGSAGYREGGLDKYAADVVLLGIGALGRSEQRYRDAYFNQVVEAVRATRVIPIHFDDFSLPLAEGLQAMPNLLDDVPASLDYLIARVEFDEELSLHMLPLWQPVVLFE